MKKNSLSAGLCFIAVSVGMGSFFAANVCVKYMQTSFWLGIAAAGVICVLLFTAAKKISKLQKNSSAQKGAEKINFKKYLTALFLFILSVVLCAHYSYVIKTWVLSDVNAYYISAGLCFAMFLTLFKDSKNIFISVALLCAFFLAAISAMRIFIILKSDTDKLFPIFERQRISLGFLKTTAVMFGIFASAGLCVNIYEKNISIAATVGAMSVCAAVFVLITASCIVLLGADQTALSYDAMVLAMKQSSFLGRGDLLFFAVWTFFMISAFCMVSNAAIVALNLKEKSFLKNFAYAFLVFILSFFAQNKLNVNKTLVITLLAGGAVFIFTVAIQAACIKINAAKEVKK